MRRRREKVTLLRRMLRNNILSYFQRHHKHCRTFTRSTLTPKPYRKRPNTKPAITVQQSVELLSIDVLAINAGTHGFTLSATLSDALSMWPCDGGTKWCSSLCYGISLIGSHLQQVQRALVLFGMLHHRSNCVQLPTQFVFNGTQRRSHLLQVHFVDPMSFSSVHLASVFKHNYTLRLSTTSLTLDDEYYVRSSN